MGSSTTSRKGPSYQGENLARPKTEQYSTGYKPPFEGTLISGMNDEDTGRMRGNGNKARSGKSSVIKGEKY